MTCVGIAFKVLGTLGLWLGAFVPMYCLGFLIIPLGLSGCRKESEHLPRWLWCWDNETGINGTLRGENPGWLRICGSDEATRGFWRRLQWLAWRNPVSNWGRHVLACRVTQPVVCRIGSIRVGDGPNDKAGFRYSTSGPLKYEVYWVWPWAKTRCVRFRCGWKLNGRTVGETASFVFTLIPWKKFRGVRVD